MDSRITGPHTVAAAVCARYGTGGATHQSYYMTNKAGHLARWTQVTKTTALLAGDFKDPQVILVSAKQDLGST